MTFSNFQSTKRIECEDTADRLDARDFLKVFTFLTGRSTPVSSRRDTLTEYRLRYNEENKQWLGSKESAYEQLLRNYRFDNERYPDFNSLLMGAEKTRVMPKPFIPKEQARKKPKSLLYTENPYVKRANKNVAEAEPKTAKEAKEEMMIQPEDNPAKRKNHTYTEEDKRLILSKEIPDREIAERLGVTVGTIQAQRHSLKTSVAIRDSGREIDERHNYTFAEDKMILERNLSDREISLMIGVPIHRIASRRSSLKHDKNINTVEELNAYFSTAEADIKTEEKLSAKKTEDMEENASESIVESDGDSDKRISSLVDRTMDLMSDLEALSKEMEGKKAQLRTKARYETLLKTLINKDLQFFELTAGNDKIAAQDKYLKAIGFTDKEIAHFRERM